jgi:ribosomal protein S18 acetylase RimI-like enzyme
MKQSDPNAMMILPLAASDVEPAAALQPEGWGDIQPSIRFYCTSSFCHPLKAIINDKLVGIGTAIIYGSTAWLAHIIVHKDYRKAGIGTAITQSLMQLVQQTACETIFLIATALGEPVYKKVGFEVEARYVFLDHGNLPEPCNDAHVVAFDQRHLEALLEFDNRVSGENRGILLTDHLSDIKLFVEDEGIKGFYIPTLGEGLIISSDPVAGMELMKHKSKLNKMFCIPVANVAGIKFLEQNGYQKIREASRMLYGKKIIWDGSRIYSRIGGNLG